MVCMVWWLGRWSAIGQLLTAFGLYLGYKPQRVV